MESSFSPGSERMPFDMRLHSISHSYRWTSFPSPSDTGLGYLTSLWTNEHGHKGQDANSGPKEALHIFTLSCLPPWPWELLPPPTRRCFSFSLRPMINVIGENTKRAPCRPVAGSTQTQPVYRCMNEKHYCFKMSLGVIFMSIIMAIVNWYTPRV